MTIVRKADMQMQNRHWLKDYGDAVSRLSLPAHRWCFGLPKDALIIPPNIYPRPRDSLGNTPFVGQLPE